MQLPFGQERLHSTGYCTLHIQLHNFMPACKRTFVLLTATKAILSGSVQTAKLILNYNCGVCRYQPTIQSGNMHIFKPNFIVSKI